MKYFTRLVCLFLVFGFAQVAYAQKYATQGGAIDFSSDAPLELIEASSKKLRGVIDVNSNGFAFLVKMESFQGFNSELQRTHFNENYMESAKFPEAKFVGKIIDEFDATKPGKYNVRAKGKLHIHGIVQERTIQSVLEVKEGSMHITAKFRVPLVDHDISIPKIVNQKIATEISVEISAEFVKK